MYMSFFLSFVWISRRKHRSHSASYRISDSFLLPASDLSDFRILSMSSEGSAGKVRLRICSFRWNRAVFTLPITLLSSLIHNWFLRFKSRFIIVGSVRSNFTEEDYQFHCCFVVLSWSWWSSRMHCLFWTWSGIYRGFRLYSRISVKSVKICLGIQKKKTQCPIRCDRFHICTC